MNDARPFGLSHQNKRPAAWQSELHPAEQHTPRPSEVALPLDLFPGGPRGPCLDFPPGADVGVLQAQVMAALAEL